MAKSHLSNFPNPSIQEILYCLSGWGVGYVLDMYSYITTSFLLQLGEISQEMDSNEDAEVNF